jgi:hypothetical protein
VNGTGVGVDSPEGLSGLLGILSTVPIDIALGDISGFSEISSSMDTPNWRAIELIVSPDLTV